MICKKPFRNGSLTHGCGGCLPCLINKKRLWTHRIVLESLMHEHNSFITLTYDSSVGPVGTLIPFHMTRWLKRLRGDFPDRKFRYFLVGEYGDKYKRPHYHVALFGYPSCPFFLPGVDRVPCDCSVCLPIAKSWGLGRVTVDPLEFGSAQYIAGYVTKKMTVGALRYDPSDRVKSYLNGRYPEFSRMSRKPGIGAPAMEVLACRIEENGELVLKDGDVPLSLNHGRKSLPLGRYLRQKLREKVGLEAQKELSLQKYLESVRETEMLAMSEAYEKGGAQEYKAVITKKLEQNSQAVLNIETKYKILNSKKGSL